MNPMLKKLLARYMAPAGDEGADTGGAGTADTDVATLDDDDAYMAQSEEERRRLRGDHATDEPNADTLAALVAAGEQQTAANEAAAGGADPEDAGGDKGGAGIPRARFNEVNDRRKALETEVEELRAQLAARNGAAAPAPAAPPAAQSLSIQDAEEQYAQLMLDGDTKAAAALRLQINAAIEEAALARFNQASASERAQTQTAATVEQLLGQFPWLESPEGAEALELIEASAAMKMQRGMPKAQAISEATLAIAPRFAPPYGVRQEGGASGDMRTQRANERGAAHSLQQPPLPQAGMGNRATPVQVDTSKLSDEEYMALPEAERKKARGD